MNKTILSANIQVHGQKNSLHIHPGPRINVLTGEYAEQALWSLAQMLDLSPHPTELPICGEVQWPDGTVYGIRMADRTAICVDYIKPVGARDCRSLVKRFHKRWFLEPQKEGCIFDGTCIDRSQPTGEGKLLLKAFDAFCQSLSHSKGGKPLFLCNFLERLDESVDLCPIFEALAATGRQVFIAVSPSYPTKALEELPYETTVHSL